MGNRVTFVVPPPSDVSYWSKFVTQMVNVYRKSIREGIKSLVFFFWGGGDSISLTKIGCCPNSTPLS